MADYAIHFEPEAYSLSGKIMGRQAAGAAFIRAIANARPETVWCYARTRDAAQICAEALTSAGSRIGVVHVPLSAPERLRDVGLLYRADPGIAQEAWRRLASSDPRAYSLCGITHTIHSHGVTSTLAELLAAPLEPWDALICTSRAGRDAVRYVIEQSASYLCERLGAARFTLPQFPVIPLGVHTSDFAFGPGDKQAARVRLGLAETDIAVLFAGRLIMHGKAHPLPMYLALEKASAGQSVTLMLAGTAPNDAILRAFLSEAERFCPSVRVMHVPGSDQDLYRAAWAAADIFTSLSDNIQETFGLTPVEAMAAGLPVVVSDWDGYKDTVRDGIDGFRIPTLTLPPGSGAGLADRYDVGLDNFDYFSGHASQLVAVSVPDAENAFRSLITDPALRHRMGEAGRKRAQENFDWSVVFRRYLDLWGELAERRRSEPTLHRPLSRRRSPARPDPFSMFSSYPSACLGTGVKFRLVAGIDISEALSRRELDSTGFARVVLPAMQVVEAVFAHLENGCWSSLDKLCATLSDAESGRMQAALVWLAKVGVLQFEID